MSESKTLTIQVSAADSDRLLAEAIRHHFPDSPLYLQHLTDPEYDHPQLAVYIDRPKELNAEEAIDTLEQIDDEWWSDAERRSQDKMFIGFY